MHGCTHGAVSPAPVQLADILRASGENYRAAHPLRPEQHRAMRAIVACRTAELGGNSYRCEYCGALTHRYRSCGNRHCPRCQMLPKERWLAARRAELLPVPYFHVVFTLPHALNRLAHANRRWFYERLFASASATLLEFGANRRWLGAQLAATLLLHTWDQRLGLHLHVHALVSAGGLSPEGQFVRTRAGFLFPVRALSAVFRGKFLDALEQALERHSLKLPEELAAMTASPARAPLLYALRAQPWVVYAKRPLAGAEQVLQYLGRYTHRVAISNERLLGFDAQSVTFRFRDSAHGNRRKLLTLPIEQFIGRFLLHVLPKGFVRIRHYGLLANRTKAQKLAAARALLEVPAAAEAQEPLVESVAAFVLRVMGIDLALCPHCHRGRLVLVAVEAPSPRLRGPPLQR